MDAKHETTADRVRLLRGYLRLSQKELASRVGVKPSTISGIERGAQGISGVAERLAQELGTTLDYLYCLTDNPQRPNDDESEEVSLSRNDPGRDNFIRAYDEADEIGRQAMREMVMTIQLLTERRKTRVIG